MKKITLQNIADQLAKSLEEQKKVDIKKVEVEDEDVSYPILRLYIKYDIDEDEVDNYIEFLREELKKMDLTKIYDEYEERYVHYEVGLIQCDWDFEIFLIEK